MTSRETYTVTQLKLAKLTKEPSATYLCELHIIMENNVRAISQIQS